MKIKDEKLRQDIINYVSKIMNHEQCIPSIRKIAEALNISKSTAQRYFSEIKKDGIISTEGYRIKSARKPKKANEEYSVPMTVVKMVGTISCGKLNLSEQNITEELLFPKTLLGSGEYYMLKASGNSMIGVGIEDGDNIVIKKQDTAENGDIVVALVGNETTLKRLIIDGDEMYLHPENEDYDDIYIEGFLQVQGIATMILKRV